MESATQSESHCFRSQYTCIEWSCGVFTRSVQAWPRWSWAKCSRHIWRGYVPHTTADTLFAPPTSVTSHRVWRADADFGDAMAWNNELIKHFSLRKNFTVLLYRKRTKDNRDLFCTKTWFWQDPAEHSHWNSLKEAMWLRACKNYVQGSRDATKCKQHAWGTSELPPLISRPAWYRSSPTSTIHIPLVIIGATPEFVKMVSILIRIVPLK